MSNVSSSNSQGVHVPKLRFPGFEGDWVIASLKEICKYQTERCEVERKDFISTENMLQNCAGIEAYQSTAAITGIKFDAGDMLLANIRPYLKKAWCATFAGGCSTDVLVFHPTGVEPDFLHFLMSRDAFFTYVMSGVKGSKMPRGDKSHIMDYLIGYPSAAEQLKIAAFLNALNKRIEKQRRLVELLKSYKRGVLTSIFEHKFDLSKCEWFPHHISELLCFEQPQKYIVTNENYCDDYRTPVLTANKGFILGYTNESDGIYNNGPVIIYDDFTMDMKYVTFPFKVKSSTIKMLTARPGNDLFFIFCLLQSLNLTPEGHQRSYISRVEPMETAVPALDVQIQIGSMLRLLSDQVEYAEKTLMKLAEAKTGIMQRLFI